MVVSTNASYKSLTLTEACNQQRAELQTLYKWVQSAATSGMWLLFCNVLKIPHNTIKMASGKGDICHSKTEWLKEDAGSMG